jgi:hypothetical protein
LIALEENSPVVDSDPQQDTMVNIVSVYRPTPPDGPVDELLQI